jgi:hypothetical protein
MRLTEQLKSWHSDKNNYSRHLKFTPRTVKATEELEKSHAPQIPGEPPDLDEIIGRIFSLFQERRLKDASPRDFRFASQGIFSEKHNLSSDERFRASYLAELAQRKRRLWMRDLLSLYLGNFDPESDVTRDVAKFLQEHHDLFSKSWQKHINNGRLLDLVEGPEHVGRQLLETDNIDAEKRSFGLNGQHEGTKFMQAAMASAGNRIGRGLRAYGKSHRLDRFISWVAPGDKILETAGSISLRSLILPFEEQKPPPVLLDKLKALFIKQYGDPRLDDSRWPIVTNDRNSQVRDQCLSIVNSWLVFESIELFMEIIKQHADRTADGKRMWDDRRRLWMQYYKAGHILNAYPIFGESAAAGARQMKNRGGEKYRSLLWGELSGAHDKTQSVLLMEIGELVICEWSHNGAFLAFPKTQLTPRLYQPTYRASHLREAGSRERPIFRQVHYRGWVELVREKLRHETGLTV